MIRAWRLLLGIGVLLGPAQDTAKAAMIYGYRLSASAVTVNTGDSFDVDVYLWQDPAAGGTLLTSEGLIGAGVQLNRMSGGIGLVAVASAADITPNPAFDFVQTKYPFDAPFPGGLALTGDELAGLLEGGLASPVKPPAGSNEILLGTFRFTASSTATGSVTIGAFQLDTFFIDEVVTFDTGTVLDASVADASTFVGAQVIIDVVSQSAVVPEPSSLVLAGLGLCGLAGYGWRRRRGCVSGTTAYDSMRWQVPGAQAMLNLRTIHTNGDWAAFQDYRIALENDWHYPNTAAYESRNWTALQAA